MKKIGTTGELAQELKAEGRKHWWQLDRAPRRTQSKRSTKPKRRTPMHEYTTEELERRALLTEQIATNLQTIIELNDQLDLDEIGQQSGAIAANLEMIEANDSDLDGLLEQTGTIAANLNVIEEDNSDLDELLQQTSTIAAHLKAIEESAA
jgi:hypothetical protein